MSKLVTVIGATGTTGGATARKLLASGVRVRAATRDPKSAAALSLAKLGAELVTADLDVRSTIRAALEGADAAYIVGPSLANRWDIGQAAQGINAVDAAVEVGIGHLVYQSALARTGRGVLSLGSKRAIEERIAELEIPATIMRPGNFMENFINYFPVKEENGALVVVHPVPLDKPLSMIAAADIARAAAAVLAAPDKYIGKEFDLVGESISLNQMAATIGSVAGKPVVPVSIPLAALEQGFPQAVSLYRWLSDRPEDDDVAMFEHNFGAPLKFRSWVEQVLAPTLK
jgi:uncharacterized protein YbjT (DUF2867 family)